MHYIFCFSIRRIFWRVNQFGVNKIERYSTAKIILGKFCVPSEVPWIFQIFYYSNWVCTNYTQPPQKLFSLINYLRVFENWEYQYDFLRIFQTLHDVNREYMWLMQQIICMQKHAISSWRLIALCCYKSLVVAAVDRCCLNRFTPDDEIQQRSKQDRKKYVKIFWLS